MDAKAFRAYAEDQLRRFDVKAFRAWGIRPGAVSRADKGQVEFMFQVEGDWVHQPPPMRCEAEFAFENGRWLLRGFELFMANQVDRFELPR